MNLLILGASGVTGRRIRKEFMREHLVYGTYCSKKDEYDSDESMFFFDIQEPDQIWNILEKTSPDIIISCLRGDFEKQLEAHRKVATYLQQKESGKLIFLSTVNVFDRSMKSPHFEQDQVDAKSSYGKYKLNCEKMLVEMLAERAIIIRIPFIWAPNGPRFQAIKDAISNNQIVPCFPEHLYCDHTTDFQIAGYIRSIIDYDRKGIFHVSTNQIESYSEFIRRMIQKMGYKNVKIDHTNAEKSVFALLTERNDVEDILKITNDDVIDYLVNNSDSINSL